MNDTKVMLIRDSTYGYILYFNGTVVTSGYDYHYCAGLARKLTEDKYFRAYWQLISHHKQRYYYGPINLTS
jgi:hypothetical protein